MLRNRKRVRVERAQERQAAYDLLTPDQKLDRATARAQRSGASKVTREEVRLAKLVNRADSKGSK